MYKIMIGYEAYHCNNEDLISVLACFQRMWKIDNGQRQSIPFSVEEVGSEDAYRVSEFERVKQEAEQRSKWWLSERNKVAELENKIKELESRDA